MMTIEPDGLVRVADGARNAAIAPGDWELAELVLTADELAQVEAAWTPQVIEAWEAAHPTVEPGPEPPTTEERLAAVEDAVLALALGGLF